ncbi:MAG: fibronectin type III-like domain-contianing protein, partial [Firmicutes bacterium]|nr:fibronectin type III-like domain-contianing protein [Bacillota bacterium]
GKKCVQLYVSVPGDRLNREYQSLAAFAKTETLAPGQSQELTLGFDLTGVAAYDALSASYGLERGDYILRLGENAQMTKPIAVLALDGDAVAERCANVCKLSRNLREIRPEKQRIDDLSDGIPRFSVAASDIPCRGDSPRPPASSPPTPVAAEPVPGPKIEAVLKKLSLDDMLRIVVATGPSDFNPYFTVPGAAAYTTSRLVKLGVPNAALCDGPAGLRLQRTSVRLKSGKIKPVDAMMEFMAYMPWPLRKFYFGNPQKGTPLYQYATAFPVGTALAQTWNTPLIEEVGKALGAEMTEFGVTFLLAPGMNIQRNPLCGRNYEYYSEDPLLSGKMAAAVTRGVQSFPGCAVTLKHFAANNQEAGRSHSDSVLSERALREIYLKGFRIAVEEGGAKAVMTSYNKINGVYAANSGDLCTKLLRGEWGFDGVVMTDWYSTGKGLAGNGRAVKAGNDLLCPGGSRYRKALKKDLKAGLVTETEIRLSCARVLEAVVGR